MAAVAAAQKNREMFAIKKSYSIENGYPSRRRSLVDDARFETLVVKQTKQTMLEEARQRENDTSEQMPIHGQEQTINGEDQPFDSSSISSSSDDEQQETLLASAANEGEAKAEASSSDCEESGDFELTEEEVVLLNAIVENPDDQSIHPATLVLSLREGMTSLPRILKAIENFKGQVCHIETRPAKRSGQFDVLVKVQMTRQSLSSLIRNLRQGSAIAGLTLLADNTNQVTVKDPWFPRHPSDLDKCNHILNKCEPDLDQSHPGFADKVYRERRKEIAELAFAYRYGDPVPFINYTEAEHNTWTRVFSTLVELVPKHACKEYAKYFYMMVDQKIFKPDRAPQLRDVSRFIKSASGFTIRPAAGLLTARDFLSSLAFRVFQSTQYVRHPDTPFHTPEPDIIHEIIGHMPMLADPGFAQFSQEIGLASLGASDEEIERLATIYWFTVEFGLCMEGKELKAYGAGCMSAVGELLHSLSDKCERRPFDPAVTCVTPYDDQILQPVYFVASSFEDMKTKFRNWVSTMKRPFELRFNPHTERIEVLDSVERLENAIGQINIELNHLTSAVIKMKRTKFTA